MKTKTSATLMFVYCGVLFGCVCGMLVSGRAPDFIRSPTGVGVVSGFALIVTGTWVGQAARAFLEAWRPSA